MELIAAFASAHEALSCPLNKVARTWHDKLNANKLFFFFFYVGVQIGQETKLHNAVVMDEVDNFLFFSQATYGLIFSKL